MIFEVKHLDTTFEIDDLKPFNQQSKAFQQAFNKADKEYDENVITVSFDNANAVLYTESNRVLIILRKTENEDY